MEMRTRLFYDITTRLDYLQKERLWRRDFKHVWRYRRNQFLVKKLGKDVFTAQGCWKIFVSTEELMKAPRGEV